jgi:hypothetical protein
MMRRFEVLRGTHLGPLQRNINPGDILYWEESSRILMINGEVIPESKNVDFEKAILVLDKQRVKEGQEPLVKELSPVEVCQANLDVMRRKKGHVG